jgi:CHAT domain/PLD-like domain/Lecithin:cholesterol acyltransferase
MATTPFQEREYVQQFEAARTPEQLATFLLDPTADEERALRTYLGTARFQRMRSLAQALGSRRGPAPEGKNTVVLPGIMGSELSVYEPPGGPVRVWLSYYRILRGGLARLRLDPAGADPYDPSAKYSVVATGALNKYYGEIALRLAQWGKARTFWYDWRKSLTTAAADLDHFLRSEFRGKPVTLVAHSMGGLVARTLLLDDPKAADGRPIVERLVMLGTPNYGSFETPQIFAGVQESVRQLVRLTGGIGGLFDSGPARSRVFDILNSFPAIYHLLPWPGRLPDGDPVRQIHDRLYDPGTYSRFNPSMSPTHLAGARAHHNRLNEDPAATDRMVYVAGYGELTVTGVRQVDDLTDPSAYEVTRSGDGRVPHDLGVLPRVPAYAVRCPHGDLARDPQVLACLGDLIVPEGMPNLPLLRDVNIAADRGANLSDQWAAQLKARQTEEVHDFEDLLGRLERRDEAAARSGRARPDPADPAGRPQADQLSPDEREVEDRLVRAFLGGGPAAGPAGNGEADRSEGRPALRLDVVRADVTTYQSVGPADLPAEALAAGVYTGVRPVGGLHALDVEISKSEAVAADESSVDDPTRHLIITGLIERGTVRGDLGAPFLLPDPRDPRRTIVLAGLGRPGTAGAPEGTLAIREVCWALGRLGKKHLVTLLIGAGAGNLATTDACRALLEGVSQALRAAQDRQVPHLQAVTIIEYSHDRFVAIHQALDVLVNEFAGRLDIDYRPPGDEVLRDHLKLGLEARQEGLQKQYEAEISRLRTDRTGGGRPAPEEPPEPSPTRVTFSMERGVYTFGAITAEASIPQRVVQVDTTQVELANDAMVAAENLADQRRAGRVLGRLIIPEDLRGQFSTSAPLVMQVDPRSARVHWEMVVQDDPRAARPGGPDEGQFLGLARGFTRQLRTALAPPPEPPADARRQLRVLIVADPAPDARLRGANQEAVEVADLFDAFNRVYGRGVEVQVTRMLGPSEAALVEVLGKLMLEPFDILHYAGHCFYQPDDPSASGLLFGANPLRVLSARELRRCDRVPRFVFLNACESGITPDRPDERQAALAPSFAEVFFERGVANFVCTGWPVDDAAARLFARRMYAGLLGLAVKPDEERRTLAVTGATDPLPLYRALHEARRAVAATRGGNRTWGAYQHYGNPYARFFDTSLRRHQRSEYVRVSIGAAAEARRPAPAPGPGGADGDRFAAVRRAIADHGDRFRGDGVVDIRPGFLYQRGWSTGRPAVVVVAHPAAVPAVRAGLESEVGGVPVDVAPAAPTQQRATDDRGGLAPVLPGTGEPVLRPGDPMIPAEPAAAERRLPYIPPTESLLDEVHDAMSVTCHLSPDHGWDTLAAFLDQTKERLTVGMYDLSAPHVVKQLGAATGGGAKSLRLVLDPGLSLTNGGDPARNPKAEDVTEDEARDELTRTVKKGLKFVWAAVKREGKTTDGIFPTSYHIKVAVRDGAAVWLSSGNWQSSNQPADDTLDRLKVSWDDPGGVLRVCNREWHVVIEHRGLAATFEKFLESDWKQAEDLQARARARLGPPETIELIVPDDPAPPETERGLRDARRIDAKPFTFTARNKVRVQPLLTPDNYADHVIRLIESARTELFFQNQYINLSPAPDPKFVRLLEALKAKVNDPRVDTRVILRDLPEARERLEALEAEGFRMRVVTDGRSVDRFRLQRGTHTKGIVVDGRVVLVGSHNWSSFGTTANRDASLIFFEEKIAQYFRTAFVHDWEHLAAPRVKTERTMPRVARGDRGSSGPDGPRVPWGAVYED